MVNYIKDIADKLDGYSVDNQGFALTECRIETPDVVIVLKVVPYFKNDKKEGVKDTEHLTQIIERLSCKYTEGIKYSVIFAEKTVDGWELRIKVIMNKE